jgi:hypothetical protein
MPVCVCECVVWLCYKYGVLLRTSNRYVYSSCLPIGECNGTMPQPRCGKIAAF